jgi:membrane protein implicated in regulation of membrane protease activity
MPALALDAILLFAILEAAILAARHRFDLLLTLLSGLALMVALRLALAGADARWLALALLAAFAAHLADLGRRWRR